MQTISSNSSFQFPPGVRFHPSDEELIVYYLQNKLNSLPLPAAVIGEIELYSYNPWDLPKKAPFGDDEWYFFSPRDRKYPNGARPNRTAASGYWKATGTDKPILSSSGSRNIGVKKALVFYIGKPPNGVKTDWIMIEYRIPDTLFRPQRSKTSMRLDDWVLCRIRQKGNLLSKIGGRENMCSNYFLQKDCHLLANLLVNTTTTHQDFALPIISTVTSNTSLSQSPSQSQSQSNTIEKCDESYMMNGLIKMTKESRDLDHNQVINFDTTNSIMNLHQGQGQGQGQSRSQSNNNSAKNCDESYMDGLIKMTNKNRDQEDQVINFDITSSIMNLHREKQLSDERTGCGYGYGYEHTKYLSNNSLPIKTTPHYLMNNKNYDISSYCSFNQDVVSDGGEICQIPFPSS